MTRDEIIRTAKLAGAKFDANWELSKDVNTDTFVRFANFIITMENEECALACTCNGNCSELIRARLKK